MDGDGNLIGLNIKVDIYRPTFLTDPEWNVIETSYPALPTFRNVRARISTLRAEQKASLQAIGTSVSTTAAYGVFFNSDQDVQIKDHITHNGKTYEVVALDDMDKNGQHLEGIVVFWEGVVE